MTRKPFGKCIAFVAALLAAGCGGDGALPVIDPRETPLKDGTSLLKHVFGRFEDGASPPSASSKPGENKATSSKAGEDEKKKTPAVTPDETGREASRSAELAAGLLDPGVPGRDATRDNVLLLLRTGTRSERIRAMNFAAREKYARAVPVLGRMLREEGTFSGYAAETLGAIGGPRAAKALFAGIERGRIASLRAKAFGALASMQDPAAGRIIVKCLTLEDAAVRCWAARTAACRRIEGAEKPLAAILENVSEPVQTRVWAAAAIECLSPGNTDARRMLLSTLYGRDRAATVSAVQALAAVGSAWAVGEITGLVYSTDHAVARDILSLLRRLPPGEALAALDSVSGGVRHSIRYKVVRTLTSGKVDGRVLAEAIVSQDSFARDTAVEAAAEFKVEDAVSSLGALAQSTSSAAERERAVRALSAIGTKSALETLAAIGASATYGPAKPAPQFTVTKVYTDAAGGLKGVIVADGKEERMYHPDKEGRGGWRLIGIEKGNVILENTDGRKLSLPVPKEYHKPD